MKPGCGRCSHTSLQRQQHEQTSCSKPTGQIVHTAYIHACMHACMHAYIRTQAYSKQTDRLARGYLLTYACLSTYLDSGFLNYRSNIKLCVHAWLGS